MALRKGGPEVPGHGHGEEREERRQEEKQKEEKEGGRRGWWGWGSDAGSSEDVNFSLWSLAGWGWGGWGIDSGASPWGQWGTRG